MKNNLYIKVDIIQKIYNIFPHKNIKNYEERNVFFRPLNLCYDWSDNCNCHRFVPHHCGIGLALLWVSRYLQLELS